MYPADELNELSRRKQRLRAGIASSRLRCVECARVVAKPIELFDRLRVLWGKVAPLARVAAVPLMLLWQLRSRKTRGQTSAWRHAFTLVPMLLTAARSFRAR